MIFLLYFLLFLDEQSKKQGLLTQGHPFAHFVSSCAQTAESDLALALALAPGGQILGRQPLPPGQLQALLDAGSSGGREEVQFPVLVIGSQLQPWRWLSVTPQGRNEEKEALPSLPSSPALFLYTQAIAQALARRALEQLPQSLNVALSAPNVQCELGDC